jgi:hypothetical protein
VDELFLQGSLRIPVLEFYQLKLTKDYCSMHLGDEAAMRLMAEVTGAGKGEHQ